MTSLIEYIKIVGELLLCLIPRYITDRVAVNNNNGSWTVVCLEDQVTDELEIFIHRYGTIKTITWFGIGFGGWVKLDEK